MLMVSEAVDEVVWLHWGNLSTGANDNRNFAALGEAPRRRRRCIITLGLLARARCVATGFPHERAAGAGAGLRGSLTRPRTIRTRHPS